MDERPREVGDERKEQGVRALICLVEDSSGPIPIRMRRQRVNLFKVGMELRWFMLYDADRARNLLMKSNRRAVPLPTLHWS